MSNTFHTMELRHVTCSFILFNQLSCFWSNACIAHGHKWSIGQSDQWSALASAGEGQQTVQMHCWPLPGLLPENSPQRYIDSPCKPRWVIVEQQWRLVKRAEDVADWCSTCNVAIWRSVLWTQQWQGEKRKSDCSQCGSGGRQQQAIGACEWTRKIFNCCHIRHCCCLQSSGARM